MNKNYSVQVTETFQRVVKIEADSPKEAINMVSKEMNEGDGLGCEDFVGRDIELYDSSVKEDSTVKDSPNLNKSEKIMFRMNSFIANVMAQGFVYDKWTKDFLNEETAEAIENFHNSEDFKRFDLSEVRTEILQLFGFNKFNKNLLAVPLWFFILMPKDYMFLSCSGFSHDPMKMTPVSAIDTDTRVGCVFAFVKRDDIK